MKLPNIADIVSHGCLYQEAPYSGSTTGDVVLRGEERSSDALSVSPSIFIDAIDMCHNEFATFQDMLRSYTLIDLTSTLEGFHGCETNTI